MRLPRDLSGMDPAKALGRVGYRVVRQTGSHLRLSRDGSTQHHITIPAHDPLKVGTLAAILNHVTDHSQLERDQLVERLFG